MRPSLKADPLRRVAALCLIAFAFGCSDAPTGPGPVELSATLDGQSWTADARPAHPFALLDGTTLEIRAVRTERTTSNQAAVSTLIITIPNYRGIRTYPLGGDSGNHAVYRYEIESNGVSYSTLRGTTGTFTVGAVDARDGWMSGSFSFDAQDGRGTAIAVRDGRFIGPLTRR